MPHLGSAALRLGAVAAAAALALTACSAAPSDKPTVSWPTLTIGSLTDVTSFDPAKAAEGNLQQYFQAVFDSLLLCEPDGTIAPMLATDWSLSSDSLTATLDLRDDVTFSDGTKLTADVVKQNLEHFRDGGGPSAATLSKVASVDVVDADTVALHLSAVDPDLFLNLCTASGYIASAGQLAGPDIDTVPIGSGSYELDPSRTVAGSQYTFVKRDDYWDTDATWNFYDTLVIKPILDPTARLNALKAGEIDNAVIDARMLDEAKASNLNVITSAVNWYGLTLFDRDGKINPALADVRVRQAINYAFDKDAILQAAALGYGDVTAQTFGPDAQGYLPALDDAYSYDVAKAKKLMADAGYADGFDLVLPLGSSQDPSVTAAVESMLGAIGVKVVWEPKAGADFITDTRAGKYAGTIMTFATPASGWTTVSRFVLPTAPWNIFKTANADVDALTKKALTQLGDEAAFTQTMESVNSKLVELAWWAPWYRVQQGAVTVAGLQVTPQAGQQAASIYNFSVS